MRNKLLFTITLVLIIQLFAPLSIYGKKDPTPNISLHSSGVAVLDAKTGRLLYGKNENKRFYPASCTKILTTIIALEEGNLSDKITVSDNAVFGINVESSHIALDEGEIITLENALYGMLMASGNDCAMVTAEHIGGSVDNFSQMMNEKATELGCENSHFVNPHGLSEDDHYSTPYDMGKIMAYCIKNPEFINIDSTLIYDVEATNKSEPRKLWNSHRMVKDKYWYYAPVIGGKDGYTTESNFNLITYGEKDGIELIVVTFGTPIPDEYCEDTEALMEFYFNNYKNATIKRSDIPDLKIQLDGKNIPYYLKHNVDVLIPKDASLNDLEYSFKESNLAFPVEKDSSIGIVEVKKDNQVIGTQEIFAKDSVAGSLKTILFIIKVIIGVIVLLILFIFLLRIRNKLKTKRRKRRIQRRYR